MTQSTVAEQVFAAFPGRAADRVLHGLARTLSALADATELADRIDGLIALAEWSRRGGGIDFSLDHAGPLPESALVRLRLLAEVLERCPEAAARVATSVHAVFDETEGVNLFAEAGIPSGRGFMNEFADRFTGHLLPAPRDDHDLASLLRRLFYSQAASERFSRMPPDLFGKLAGYLFPGGEQGELPALRRAFRDGFRLLALRCEHEGLSEKLRSRGSGGPIRESPYFRARAAADRLLADDDAGQDLAPAIAALRGIFAECRAEMELVHDHLEKRGVSVDIVYSLDVLDRSLSRMSIMMGVLEARDRRDRLQRLRQLLGKLVLSVQQDQSIRHLIRTNLQLLQRKIVDRAGETGEHYVAQGRGEYRLIWLLAGGGGLLTVGTAAMKMTVTHQGFPPFVEGLLSGLNYAVSFLILQAFGLILATKQPAMTAAALATIMRERQGAERLDEIVDYFARIVSSQLAAAIANVVVVATGALAFSYLWVWMFGRPYLSNEEARYVFETLDPLQSGTVWYAALTGAILWFASLVGGWFDNWSIYHRLPQAIAEHRLGRRIGRSRMVRLAGIVSRNMSGWGTNISLGLILGMTPVIGHFFGLPLDVRHVTLNSGVLALASSSIGEFLLQPAWLLWAIAGVGTMFVLNLSVSFGMSLWNAIRAYELPRSDVIELGRLMGRRLVMRPRDFFLPPRADGPAAAH